MTDVTVAETIEAQIWIRATLLANSGFSSAVSSQVYGGVAPNSATYPFVTMQILSTDDRPLVGGGILWSDVVMLVRATIDKRSAYEIRSIAAAIQQLLHAKSGTTVDAKIVSCSRIRPHAAPTEETDGIFYSHLGGEYRIRVKPKGNP